MTAKNNHKYMQQAQDFENQHQVETTKMIQRFLQIITQGIWKNDGLIHFGNVNLFVKNGIPYECAGWIPYYAMTEAEKQRAVELYSDDGWNTLEDIANWADIVEDYNNTKAQGPEAMKERGYLPKEKESPKTLTRDQILEAIRSFAMSQGFYGRLLESIQANEDILEGLEKQGFTSVLDMVLYLEG